MIWKIKTNTQFPSIRQLRSEKVLSNEPQSKENNDIILIWQNLICTALVFNSIILNYKNNKTKFGKGLLHLDQSCLPCDIFLESLEPQFTHFTGHVFSKRIKITPQIHTWKFKEQRTWGWVPCWGSFLTSTGSTIPEDPVDVRNEPHQGYCLQAVSSSIFLVQAWALIFILFWKNPTWL